MIKVISLTFGGYFQEVVTCVLYRDAEFSETLGIEWKVYFEMNSFSPFTSRLLLCEKKEQYEEMHFHYRNVLISIIIISGYCLLSHS